MFEDHTVSDSLSASWRQGVPQLASSRTKVDAQSLSEDRLDVARVSYGRRSSAERLLTHLSVHQQTYKTHSFYSVKIPDISRHIHSTSDYNSWIHWEIAISEKKTINLHVHFDRLQYHNFWEIAKSRKKKNLNYIYALRDIASNVKKTQWISISILTI